MRLVGFLKKLNLDNKKVLLLSLILIFLTGFSLRFINLSSVPAGFQMDEASKGYSAYSLLKTGKDDNNNFLSLSIDMFGDNSPAGYHYFTILPVAVFGLNEFAVRFPGALLGSLTILAFYFFIYSLFENKKLSLLGALLLALSPWHINMSRASSESLVALFFIITGFAYIFRSLKSKALQHLFFGTLFLAISFFFYQTPRFFVPLFFLAFLIYLVRFWKLKLTTKHTKAIIMSFILLSLFVGVLFFVVPGGSGRFTQVNIFNSAGTKILTDEQVREEGLIGTNVWVTRLFHNKAVGFTQAYLSNYFEYFSWNFLFLKGLPPVYQIPGMGVLYTVELPFVIAGIFLLILDKNKASKIPLLWLIIGPTAAAVAVDTNNLQRALVTFPMFELITAYAIVNLYDRFLKNRKKVFVLVTCFLFAINIIYFFHQYYVLAAVHEPWYRNNAFGQMMALINKDYKNYDKIITTKSVGGYPLFQFYSKYDPAKYQSEGSPKDKNYKGFGKFIFAADNCPFISKDPLLPRTGKIIFIEDGSCKETSLLQKVPYTYVLRVDTTKAFRIVYVQNAEQFFNNNLRSMLK